MIQKGNRSLQFIIDYPETFPDALQQTRQQFEHEAKWAMAVKLFEMKRLSSGMAAAQGWSLNPGRYVGVAQRKEAEDFDFAERLEELNEELEILNVEARELEERIAENVAQILNL